MVNIFNNNNKINNYISYYTTDLINKNEVENLFLIILSSPMTIKNVDRFAPPLKTTDCNNHEWEYKHNQYNSKVDECSTLADY